MYTHAKNCEEIQERYEPFRGPPADRSQIKEFCFYVHFLRGRINRYFQRNL